MSNVVDEAQVRAMIQEAVQAERDRIAGIFRGASAQFHPNYTNGPDQFDFDATFAIIAQEIENG